MLNIRRTLRLANAMRFLLSHGFSASLSARGAALILGLAVNVLLARLLGPMELGTYALALTVITMFAVPLHDGAATLLVREVARSAAVGAWGRLRGCLRAANVGVVVTVAAVIALVVPLVLLCVRHEEQALWLWALLLLPLYSLAGLRGAVLLGLQRPVLGQLPDQILRPLLFGFALLLFSRMSQTTATSAMSLHVGAAFCAFLAGTALLLKVLPREVADANAEYDPRGWLRSLAPFTLMAGIQVFNSSLATLLLGYFGKYADIAFYRVAYLGASLVAVSLIAGDQILAPRIAALHASGDLIELQRQVVKMTRLMLCVALPMALVIAISGEPLVRFFFGRPYSDAHWPLVVLTIGQLINVGAGPAGSLLTMTGHENSAMHAIILQMLLNLALGVVLIPNFGAIGAAIATAVSMVVLNLTCIWRVRILVQVRSAPW